MTFDPKAKKQKLIRGLMKMVKGNVLWPQLVNKGLVMPLMRMHVGHPWTRSPLQAFPTSNSMFPGVYRKAEASSQGLMPISPKAPEHGYLMDFMLLKFL